MEKRSLRLGKINKSEGHGHKLYISFSSRDKEMFQDKFWVSICSGMVTSSTVARFSVVVYNWLFPNSAHSHSDFKCKNSE